MLKRENWEHALIHLLIPASVERVSDSKETSKQLNFSMFLSKKKIKISHHRRHGHN